MRWAVGWCPCASGGGSELCRAPCTICCKILKQIGNRIALGLEGGSRERIAGSRLRIDTGGVIDEVGFKAAFLDLFRGQIAGELVDDGGNHLLMGHFFRPF